MNILGEKIEYKANRVISISKLHMSPCFHTWPINVLVSDDSQGSSGIEAAVTLWEATAPVKLPTTQCPGSG